MDQLDKDAEESRWWAEWFAEDFSWEGLAKLNDYGEPAKRWNGWVVVLDDGGHYCAPEDEMPGGEESRPASLQDYWRADPENSWRLRTDEELWEAGELTPPNHLFDGKYWHIAHHPDRSSAGKRNGWKVKPAHHLWDSLQDIFANRIGKAQETEVRPFMTDRRALLDGVIFGRPLPEANSSSNLIHLSVARSAFLHDANYWKRHFGQESDFSYTLFTAKAEFRDAKFGGGANFEGSKFFAETDFSGTRFHEVSFASAYFLDDADFGSLVAKGEIDFSSAIFCEHSWFAGASFQLDAQFDEAQFRHDVSFESVKFDGNVTFYGACFSGGLRFIGVKVAALSVFNSANFVGDTAFHQTSFGGDAIFNNARFERYATFSGSVFTGTASFDRAAFGGEVRFGQHVMASERPFLFEFASFQGPVSFRDTEFERPAYFTGTRFCAEARFSRARFKAVADFRCVAFADPETNWRSAFDAAVFEDLLDFRQSQYRLISMFDGARLDGGVAYPKPGEREALRIFDEDVLASIERGDAKQREGALNAVEHGARTLKHQMRVQADHLREQRSYRYELKARRRQEGTRWPERWSSRTFGFFADYGLSFARPVAALLATAAIFSLVYFLLAPIVAHMSLETLTIGWRYPVHPAVVDALELALSNMLGPIRYWASEFKPYDDAAGSDPGFAFRFVIGGLSMLQQLISVTLIFLAAVALRRRFQIA